MAITSWTDVTATLTGVACASTGDTRTIAHTIDGLGRRTRSEVTAGPDTGDRTYDVTLDSAGATRTSATRTGGVTATTTFTLTILDEVSAEARPDGSTAKTNHDPAGNPTDACYWKSGITVGACLAAGTTPWPNPPTKVTTTGYDARNNRISLRTPALGETTYDPDHNYQVAAVYVPTKVDGNGTPTHEFQALYTYETSEPTRRHRLISITERLCVLSSASLHTCSSTTATGSVSYEYDATDSVTKVIEDNGAGSLDRRYCYDALGRLIFRNTAAACGSAAKDEAWTYDDAGNRLTAWTQASGVTRTFTYSADGQLTAITNPAESLTYDAAGRVATDAGWAYEYDPDGRLASACHAASCTGSGFDRLDFSYDGDGRRTKILATSAGVGVTTTDLTYSGDAPAQEITNGTVTRTYVTDEGGTIVRFCDPDCANPTATYLVGWSAHGDALNTSRINADGTLTLANSYRYDTWGRPTTTTHNSIPDLGFRYLYVGAADVQWDNQLGAGLLYMHARTYHPALGRFLQPDPARADASLYGYVENSPVTKVDPSGTMAECVLTLWNPLAFLGCLGVNLGAIGGVWAMGLAVGAMALFLRSSPARRHHCIVARACGAYYLHLAQQQKKKLDGLRQGRKTILDKLRRGDVDPEGHWRDNLAGVERQIRAILRDHPQWRRSGDPR